MGLVNRYTPSKYSVTSDDPLVSTWRSPARIIPNSRRSTNWDRMQSQKNWMNREQSNRKDWRIALQGTEMFRKMTQTPYPKPLLHSLSLFLAPWAELLVHRVSNTLFPQPNPPPCHSYISLSSPRFIISPPSLLNLHSITSSSLVRDLEFDTWRAWAGWRGEEGQPQLEYFKRHWSPTWPYHLSSASDPPLYPVRRF